MGGGVGGGVGAGARGAVGARRGHGRAAEEALAEIDGPATTIDKEENGKGDDEVADLDQDEDNGGQLEEMRDEKGEEGKDLINDPGVVRLGEDDEDEEEEQPARQGDTKDARRLRNG